MEARHAVAAQKKKERDDKKEVGSKRKRDATSVGAEDVKSIPAAGASVGSAKAMAKAKESTSAIPSVKITSANALARSATAEVWIPYNSALIPFCYDLCIMLNVMCLFVCVFAYLACYNRFHVWKIVSPVYSRNCFIKIKNKISMIEICLCLLLVCVTRYLRLALVPTSIVVTKVGWLVG